MRCARRRARPSAPPDRRGGVASSRPELEADRLREAIREVTEGLRLARKRGDRVNESLLLSQHVPCLVTLGEWEEASAALRLARELLDDDPSGYEMITAAYELCLEAAVAAGDDGALAALEDHVDALAPIGRTPIRWLARSEQPVA